MSQSTVENGEGSAWRLLKVGGLHFQGDSAAPDAGRLAMPPRLADDGLQRVAHRLECVKVLREGVLRRDRAGSRRNAAGPAYP